MGEGRNYWSGTTGFRRWLLETIVPIPLIGLTPEGGRLLAALEWLEENCRSAVLGEDVLRAYHRRIYSGKAEPAGEYRKGRISVVGSTIPRPGPEKVPALMKQLDLQLKTRQGQFDLLPLPPEADVLRGAVDLYQRLGLIHPFPDANGRLARLAMNHLLRRYGLGYVIFPPLNEPGPLWNALQEAHMAYVPQFRLSIIQQGG